jgi:hypothetical protein
MVFMGNKEMDFEDYFSNSHVEHRVAHIHDEKDYWLFIPCFTIYKNDRELFDSLYARGDIYWNGSDYLIKPDCFAKLLLDRSKSYSYQLSTATFWTPVDKKDTILNSVCMQIFNRDRDLFDSLHDTGDIFWNGTYYLIKPECVSKIVLDNPELLEGYLFSLGYTKEGKEYYWKRINAGYWTWAAGLIPIYAKEKDWENAIKVCDIFLTNEKIDKIKINPRRLKQIEERRKKYASYLNNSTEMLSAKNVLVNCLITYREKHKPKTKRKVLLYENKEKLPKWTKNKLRSYRYNIPVCVDGMYPRWNYFILTKEQARFYKLWSQNWRNKKPMKLDGNHGYLVKFMSDMMKRKYDRKAVITTRNEMKLLWYVYRNENFTTEPDINSYILSYIVRYVFDSYLLTKDYIKAINWMQLGFEDFKKSVSSDRSATFNVYLSLKYEHGIPLTGREFIALYQGDKNYIFKENIELMYNYIEDKIREYEEINNVDLLSLITLTYAFQSDGKYPVLKLGIREFLPMNYYNYFELSDFRIVMKEWVDDAENKVREGKGLPKINEGWLNETTLYNIIKEHFEGSGYTIFHRAYPSFLDGLELDIYMPALKIGIEYQGRQHYEPIGFFGGVEAFKKLQIRDEKKRNLCKKNGIKLIEFNYQDSLNEKFVIEKIYSYIDQRDLKE